MGNMRCAALAFALVIGVAAAMAQEAKPPKTLIESGRLTYGTAATFAPFEFQKGGELAGFDIELGEAVAKKLGLKTNILNMEFKGLIPALQGKRIDIINSAMYINPQRAEQVDFIPYMRIGNEIVVRKGNPKNVKSRADLCGLRVAVTLGAIEETYARQDSKKCVDSGRPAVEVLTFPTAQDSALAVRQGRADVHFSATPGAVLLVAELPEVFEIAGQTFEANTLIGIAVRKGDAEMKRAIEEALKAVVKDGTYSALLKKYGLPATGSVF